jgi:hypothetical protein
MSLALRRMCRRGQVVAVALAGIAAAVAAKNEKHPIAVVAEPTSSTFDLDADVTVKLTIKNNGKGSMSFQTCPEPYSVELKDSQGMPAPKRVPIPPVVKDGELTVPAELSNLVECGWTILVTLEPGNSWNVEVSLGRYFDLKSPGSYTGTITWLAGEVPSNTFRFTIRAKQKS